MDNVTVEKGQASSGRTGEAQVSGKAAAGGPRQGRSKQGCSSGHARYGDEEITTPPSSGLN